MRKPYSVPDDVRFSQHIVKGGRPRQRQANSKGSHPHGLMFPMALEMRWRAYLAQFPDTSFNGLMKELLHHYLTKWEVGILVEPPKSEPPASGTFPAGIASVDPEDEA